MRDLASRDAYGCVLLDILCLLCRPFLQRKGPESAQEYNSLSAECILHAFHETLDYQANGPAIVPSSSETRFIISALVISEF